MKFRLLFSFYTKWYEEEEEAEDYYSGFNLHVSQTVAKNQPRRVYRAKGQYFLVL